MCKCFSLYEEILATFPHWASRAIVFFFSYSKLDVFVIHVCLIERTFRPLAPFA